MSKVQCFKLPAGSFKNMPVYVVISFSSGKILGFAAKPDWSGISKNINTYIEYGSYEVNEIIDCLADNPEKVWEVEV
jgi:hypothetical protein